MIGYLDPIGGVSGDMFLGALVDAGVRLDDLVGALGRLPERGVRIEAHPVERGHLRATQVTVLVEAPDGTPARTLPDILSLLEDLGLHPADAERAAAVFRRLAAAEARVHGADDTRVHFHEVGALDAVADIVGTVAGLRLLGVTRLTAGPLPIGHGVVRSEHGILPNPAPATVELLAGLAVRPVDVEAELVTPTGAALVATLTTSATPGPGGPSFVVRRIGAGAGSREIAGRPNVLRLFVGDAEPDPGGPVGHDGETVVVLRTTVDNATPEVHGYLMETLLDRGALEVFTTPVVMKKSRPGVLVTVLAEEDRWADLARTVLAETGSIGLRVTREARIALPRRIVTVTTPWGPARVKVADLGNGDERAAPEYEDARALARRSGRPLREVMAGILERYAQDAATAAR